MSATTLSRSDLQSESEGAACRYDDDGGGAGLRGE